MSSKKPSLAFSALPSPAPPLQYPLRRPSPFITTNNFGGGFVSDDDRVALTALRFADANSMGASCMSDDSDSESMPASLAHALAGAERGETDQMCIPLPTWAFRAGARETIYLTPKETKVASE